MADEETYSLIFSSLKHPVRRKILRMLRDGELTFSQILEILSIDSGHLSYHLENLGDLITHSSDGKYRLSSFGMAAVRLMNGVEEHGTPKASRDKSRINASFRIFSIILAVVLLLVSIYSVNLTTQIDQPFLDLPRTFASSSNQPFEFNLTLIYGNSESRISEPHGFIIMTHEPANTMSEWIRYPLLLDCEFNKTYSITVTVRDPSNHVTNVGPLQGETGGYFGVGLGVYMSQNGTYQIEIENAQTDWLYGNVTLHVRYEIFQRPLFYYGLAGVITTSSYPMIVLLVWFWTKKSTA
jgi:DNA-binding transcriptional ArsR family regulator